MSVVTGTGTGITSGAPEGPHHDPRPKRKLWLIVTLVIVAIVVVAGLGALVGAKLMGPGSQTPAAGNTPGVQVPVGVPAQAVSPPSGSECALLSTGTMTELLGGAPRVYEAQGAKSCRFQTDPSQPPGIIYEYCDPEAWDQFVNDINTKGAVTINTNPPMYATNGRFIHGVVYLGKDTAGCTVHIQLAKDLNLEDPAAAANKALMIKALTEVSRNKR